MSLKVIKLFGGYIIRKKENDKFTYFYPNGKIVSEKDLKRINKLIIPPKVNKVEISENPNEKIQATWIDKKGKKQYKYHQEHITNSTIHKFHRLYDFINRISHFEKVLKEHLKLNNYNKKKVIALMFIIVKEFNIRVGKEYYAQHNKSYGISSLKKSHFKIESNKILLRFKAKSKQQVSYTITNPNLIKELQYLNELPGIKMFQYVNDNQNIVKVNDTDMNKYLQKYMGVQFTVKDFRTYGANYKFIEALLKETKMRNPKNKKIIKKNILNAYNTTAHYLRHTKSISKKSYVNNIIEELYFKVPQSFIEHKNDEDPNELLLKILKLYKKTNNIVLQDHIIKTI